MPFRMSGAGATLLVAAGVMREPPRRDAAPGQLPLNCNCSPCNARFRCSGVVQLMLLRPGKGGPWYSGRLGRAYYEPEAPIRPRGRCHLFPRKFPASAPSRPNAEDSDGPRGHRHSCRRSPCSRRWGSTASRASWLSASAADAGVRAVVGLVAGRRRDGKRPAAPCWARPARSRRCVAIVGRIGASHRDAGKTALTLFPSPAFCSLKRAN